MDGYSTGKDLNPRDIVTLTDKLKEEILRLKAEN